MLKSRNLQNYLSEDGLTISGVKFYEKIWYQILCVLLFWISFIFTFGSIISFFFMQNSSILFFIAFFSIGIFLFLFFIRCCKLFNNSILDINIINNNKEKYYSLFIKNNEYRIYYKDIKSYSDYNNLNKVFVSSMYLCKDNSEYNVQINDSLNFMNI